MTDKTYHYRAGKNDTWEVYSLLQEDDGPLEDWLAFVETETIAITLVFAMSHSVEMQNMMDAVNNQTVK